MNTWEAKLCVGKTVPSDILTYLKDQEAVLRNKFMNAESRFALAGFTNKNHSKIQELEEKIHQMEISLGYSTQQNLALQQILQFAIPKDRIIRGSKRTNE